MFLSNNLKILRKRRHLTQDDLATILKIKRPTLNNYENQVSMPPIEMLMKLSDYFNISIDTLVRVDLSALSQSQMRELENGNDVFVKGAKLRVLTSTVGSDNEENIELVPEKAKAGYLTGFSDPEYIVSLPVFRLPFLDKERKYRTFQISGDSMWPIPAGAYVTGEYILNWNSIKNGQACIIFTLNDGLSFKIIENNIEQKGSIRCISLNPLFEPYEVPVGEIREIWKFVHYISGEIPSEQLEMNHVVRTLADIKSEVGDIKNKLFQ
ncbi:XRE family transcriptional regulator [Alkalitalea saponilacus]|uniref:DNA-binding transcriptional regulator, XRE-family HTH domain n=1 Tax=Alkalitalea saponilacus TaxID=889453 RepID=A0A1T5HS10_9BACT|nr:LexA family transcriptional regulator [Alkalitalea saponilacus]ASB50002.1 DNA-binding protein [Alkalitalea saponilacus]SKC23488.1 DNA-binding transcriptional regulator, XRE-family HTH domain [Alkalitalea saponilacus]